MKTANKLLKTLLLERNVINVPDVEHRIKFFSRRIRFDKAKQWFSSQLKKYVLNTYDELVYPADNYYTIDPESEIFNQPWIKTYIKTHGIDFKDMFVVIIGQNLTRDIEYVIDWLNYIMTQNPNRDIRMRWEDAVAASNRWHDTFIHASNKKDNVQNNEEDSELAGTRVIFSFDNGYKWVVIDSKECLEREGNKMGHCVGGYWDTRYNETSSIIYSLRDEHNTPHATMEISRSRKQIDQLKGKQNKPVVFKYRPYVIEFLNRLTLKTKKGNFKDFDIFSNYREAVSNGISFKNGKAIEFEKNDNVRIISCRNGLKWVIDKEDHIGKENIFYDPRQYIVLMSNTTVVYEQLLYHGTIDMDNIFFHYAEPIMKQISIDKSHLIENILISLIDLLNARRISYEFSNKKNMLENFLTQYGAFIGQKNNKYGLITEVGENIFEFPDKPLTIYKIKYDYNPINWAEARSHGYVYLIYEKNLKLCIGALIFNENILVAGTVFNEAYIDYINMEQDDFVNTVKSSIT